MRIAVFGATGLLGQHTARAVLAAGHELTVLHRASSKIERLRDLTFRAQAVDLAESEGLIRALSEVDAVVHCAGYVPGLRSLHEEVQQARREMSAFCEACLSAQNRKVVVVGASSALPRAKADELASERLRYTSAPPDRNVFVQVKWALEDVALDYAQRGLALSIGIPAMAIGEYDHGPTAGRLVLGIANRSLPGYLRGRRNVMCAGDAGRGLVRCVEAGAAGERYLLAGENLSMDELVAKIARAAEVPMPRAIPLPVARSLAVVQRLKYHLGGAEPSVTDAAIKVISGGQFVSGEKARRELGFEARVSVDDAITRALTWFQANGYRHRA